MNEDETRELYVEYRTLTEQLQQIQQYLQETGENMGEVANVIAALDEFSRLNTNDKIFAPIANGIFIDARLTDPQTVRMNVGGGVVVQKSVAEAQQVLTGQRTELDKLQARATTDQATIVARLREIEQAIEAETVKAEGAPAGESPKEKHSHTKT